MISFRSFTSFGSDIPKLASTWLGWRDDLFRRSGIRERSGPHGGGPSNASRLAPRIFTLFLGIAAGLGQALGAAPITVFVSPTGNDSATGSQSAPFKTLSRARDAVRSATGRTAPGQTNVPSGWSGAEIVLSGGAYYLDEALALDGRDSGTEAHPVVYRAQSGESAVISGGVPIARSAWKPVKDPVYQTRINASVLGGAWQLDLRELAGKGLMGDIGTPGARLELILSGTRYDQARWPDESWARVASGAAGNYTAADDRVADWSPTDDRWAHGYWTDDITDTWNRVENINPDNLQVEVEGAGNIESGQWFSVVNVLEELDRAGEWWLDSQRSRIICVPHAAADLDHAVLTGASTLMENTGGNWIAFRDATFEASRSDAINVVSSTGFRLERVTVQNVGGWGVRIDGGSRALLSHVVVEDTGEGGILLRGGDRDTLSSANHVIENSSVRRFATAFRAGNPGVRLEGVGNTVRDSVVEDGPQAGVEISGNDHAVTGSVLRRLSLESGSSGAIRVDSGWAGRGSMIQANTFEDVFHSDLPAWAETEGEPAAVLLDEGSSGITVADNQFTRAGRGVVVEGGQSNTIRGNSFSGTVTPILLKSLAEDADALSRLQAKLAEVPYQSGAWTSRYPALASDLSDAAAPSNNSFRENRAMDVDWLVDATASARDHVPTSDQNYTKNGTLTDLGSLLGYSAEATPAPSPFSGLVFHVSPNGNDNNSGKNPSSPFRTLKAARDAIRSVTGRSISGGEPPGDWEGARVVIAGGTYALGETLTFDSRDSGTEQYPIEYQAEEGATVIVTGAFPVPDSAWKRIASQSDDSFAWARLPQSARGRVYRLDVAALGIDKGGLDASYNGSANWLMPIVDGRLRQMARWPNGPILESTGWHILGSVIADGGTTSDSRVLIDSSVPASWDRSSQELWAYGYWAYDWTSHWQEIKNISADGGRSQLTMGPRDWTWPIGEDPERKVFFANILQILDQNGSYVWNHGRGILYYLAGTGEPAPTGASLTLLPTVIQNGGRWPGDPANAANWMTVKGIVIEGAREKLVQVQHSIGMSLVNCTLRNCSGEGASFRFGSKNRIIGGSITNVVSSAVTMRGMGDIRSYVSGECLIDGVVVEDCGWFAQGGAPGVNLGSNWNTPSSCGVTVRNCTMRNLPGIGLTFTAARILVENNSFSNVCQLDGDAGAIYAGGRMTHRGNIVRKNSFANIKRHPMNDRSRGSLAGVYLDDSFSGVTVEENTFDTCDHGVFLMSGKDNRLLGNIFKNCSSGHSGAGIYLGSRVGWDQGKIDEDLASLPIDKDPWLTLFGDLIEMRPGGALYDTRMRPTGNVIVNNFSSDGQHLLTVHPAVVNDFDRKQLNYEIDGANPSTLRAIEELWRIE
ncbi:MAG: right-handed parallel beta-helix repeat-containing protein [Opitutaceae bacterium]